MLAQFKRLMIGVALATAPLAFFAAPDVSFAGGNDRLEIRKGVYEGIWHTDPVTIIVEKVHDDGVFTGEIHFDPNGRWGDVRAAFTARLKRDGSLTMTRNDCPQTAVTGRPDRRGRANIWSGHVRVYPAS